VDSSANDKLAGGAVSSGRGHGIKGRNWSSAWENSDVWFVEAVSWPAAFNASRAKAAAAADVNGEW
jgi:hypothetical protein